MATIRTRVTPDGPRYAVRFWTNGGQRSKVFRTLDGAKANRRKVESDTVARLVTDPAGGE